MFTCIRMLTGAFVTHVMTVVVAVALPTLVDTAAVSALELAGRARRESWQHRPTMRSYNTPTCRVGSLLCLKQQVFSDVYVHTMFKHPKP